MPSKIFRQINLDHLMGLYSHLHKPISLRISAEYRPGTPILTDAV